VTSPSTLSISQLAIRRTHHLQGRERIATLTVSLQRDPCLSIGLPAATCVGFREKEERDFLDFEEAGLAIQSEHK
jgi:hypothetical protein